MKKLILFVPILLVPILFGSNALAQGLLFRELFRPSEKPQYNFEYGGSTSNWQSPYGRTTRMKAGAVSPSSSIGESRFKFAANYENITFERPLTSGEYLESPGISGLWSVERRRKIMAEVSVLSPADTPFHSWDEISVNGNLAIAPLGSLAEKNTRHWIWFLNYSSTRSFLPNIPLLGFVYQINTDSGWNYSLGLPFLSATYFDRESLWTSRLSLGPYFYSAELGYGPPFLKLSLFSNWRQDSFFITERTRRDENLYLDQKDVGLSFKHPASKGLLMDWTVKYVFDRQHVFGKSYANETRPKLDMGTSVDLLISLIFIP